MADLVRTKTTEPSICTPAFTVSRYTNHNFRLIATVNDSQQGIRWRCYHLHRHRVRTRRENTITKLGNVQVSGVCGLREFSGTYNSVRQKQAAFHLSSDFRADGVVRSRSWFVRAHPMTRKPALSGERRRKREGKLTKQSDSSYRRDDAHNSVPIVDVVHSVNLWSGVGESIDNERRGGVAPLLHQRPRSGTGISPT